MFEKHGLRGKAYQEVYSRLFDLQQGKCAVCGAGIGERCIGHWYKVKRLVLDHSHETGELRGLLCQGCNTHVGEYEHGKRFRPEYNARIADYLSRSAQKGP